MCSHSHQSLFQLPPSIWWAAVAVPQSKPLGKAARHGVTVTLALAGLPTPPWVEEMTVVTLFFTPVDVAVTFTLNVQLPPAGIVPLP